MDSDECSQSDIEEDYITDDDEDEKEVTMEELLNYNSTNSIITNKEIYEVYLDKEKQTIPKLTKYEKTNILGIRSQQLANGAKPFIDINNTNCNVSYIANKELMERKLPFIVKRKINENTIEYWRLDDLII